MNNRIRYFESMSGVYTREVCTIYFIKTGIRVKYLYNVSDITTILSEYNIRSAKSQNTTIQYMGAHVSEYLSTWAIVGHQSGSYFMSRVSIQLNRYQFKLEIGSL